MKLGVRCYVVGDGAPNNNPPPAGAVAPAAHEPRSRVISL